MYHLHIYMKDMVGFEAILHSLNDEKCHVGITRNTATLKYLMELT